MPLLHKSTGGNLKQLSPQEQLISFLIKRAILHRGLYGKKKDSTNILELSKEAILSAVAKGYVPELDVQRTKDNIGIIYHDFSITTPNGKYKIRKYTFEELKLLAGKFIDIYSLEEILALINGKVPILLEVKDTHFYGRTAFRKYVAKHLASYKGDVAIQSFNPFLIHSIRKIIPNRPIGILLCRATTSFEMLPIDRGVKWPWIYERIQPFILILAKYDFISLELKPKDSELLKWMISRISKLPNTKTMEEISKALLETNHFISSTINDIQTNYLKKIIAKPIIGWFVKDEEDINIFKDLCTAYIIDPNYCKDPVNFDYRYKTIQIANKIQQ